MGQITFTGRPLEGEQASFLAKINAALEAHGVTKVNVESAYRSPDYNRQIGGAAHSNHTVGRALDATAYVPGRGWTPLGDLLISDASKYGLRSGAADPTFFHGAPDPNHVDDGWNQGGVTPSNPLQSPAAAPLTQTASAVAPQMPATAPAPLAQALSRPAPTTPNGLQTLLGAAQPNGQLNQAKLLQVLISRMGAR